MSEIHGKYEERQKSFEQWKKTHPGDPSKTCTCGEMLVDDSVRCKRHPNVRLRTPYERMDFEKEWDRRIDENHPGR